VLVDDGIDVDVVVWLDIEVQTLLKEFVDIMVSIDVYAVDLNVVIDKLLDVDYDVLVYVEFIVDVEVYVNNFVYPAIFGVIHVCLGLQQYVYQHSQMQLSCNCLFEDLVRLTFLIMHVTYFMIMTK